MSYDQLRDINSQIQADYQKLLIANPNVTGFDRLGLYSQARKPYNAASDAIKTSMGGTRSASYQQNMPFDMRFGGDSAGALRAKAQGYTDADIRAAGYTGDIPQTTFNTVIPGVGASLGIGMAGQSLEQLRGMEIPKPEIIDPGSTGGSGSTNIPGAGIAPGGRRGTMRQTGTSSFKGGRVKNKQVNTN